MKGKHNTSTSTCLIFLLLAFVICLLSNASAYAQQCAADFTAQGTSGCAPLTVDFYDQSSGEVVSWLWIFWNAQAQEEIQSKDKDPQVTFTTPGSWDVTLTITCYEGGDASTTKESFVTVQDCQQECVADFHADDLEGCAPFTTTFYDDSDGALYWNWYFEGGSPSSASGQGPHTVTFNNPGIYDVTLDIECAGGSDVTVKQDYITVNNCPSPCEAAFDASPRQGCAPLTVNFTDQSTNAQSWQWKFPGGNPATSTQQNPAVVYSIPGTYSVSLKIICTNGQVDSLIQTNYIVADYCPQPCEAAFDASPRQGCAPLTVNFTDQSNNAQSWYWKFPGGNPATSTQQNPTIVYSIPGTYSVSLKIICTNGQVDSLIQVSYIVADDCGGEELDFGDAPDPSYPTLMASNGARHIISPNLYLGSSIDAEPNGQPSPMATGDDQGLVYAGIPFPAGDEDGVLLPPFMHAGQSDSITVIASAPATLNAWLDYNGNGSWADAGEHIIPALPVVAGSNTFTINVPGSAQAGQSFARFRLSSDRSLSFDGLAPDGEVEDYAVGIQRGDGGNITIIKDATPKDNTPFWISVVYGSMGGAAPYRDPLSNTSTITNGPVGTYYIGESVPSGWSLTDIVVTGDSDNGSVVDVTNGKVDIDLDAGEDITVVFKNNKTAEEELFDLGDAPDKTNHTGLPIDAYPGVVGNYPTVFDPATGLPQGPRHLLPKADAWLGPDVSLEMDADLMPDMDGLTNIDPLNNAADRDDHDDGVRFPIALPHCQETWFTYIITIPPGSVRNDRYVNVWFDWNRDGDWADVFSCEANITAAEWAVQNQLIPGGYPAGTYVFATPLFRAFHTDGAIDKPIWVRISIAELVAPTPGDGRGPANAYQYGETEDYYFFSEDTTGERIYDFGDAPDDDGAPGYPTLHVNGGAYHDVVDGFHLGGLIDSEPNGQPTANAMGDDNNNIDDEDGVTFSTLLIPGQAAVVEVVASVEGILNAWIDYNANQSWFDANEHILTDVTLTAGNNTLTFNVPTTAVTGATFARFRFSRVAGVMSTGYGRAGEVEDYMVEILEGGDRPFKWIQIPLLKENPDIPYAPCFWGWDVPSVYGGTFVADDWFCKSPRSVTDIHWWGSYAEWDSAFAPPVAPNAFHIGIWTDVPKSESTDWSHPGELVWERTVPRESLEEHVVGDDFHPEYMTKPDTCFQYDFFIPEDEWFFQEGDSTIYWLSIAALYEEAPDSFVWGWKTREHFFHDDAVYVYEPEYPKVGDVALTTEPIEERWDMAFVLGTDEYFLEFDFGDAPMERYPTLLGQNGALHIYDPNVYLGETIDTEEDGQPNNSSTGDDNDGTNDDDGVMLLMPTGSDSTLMLQVTSSRSGYLNAWMDFNNNDSWDDPDEQIFRDEILPGGPVILPFDMPEDALNTQVFSRFRFSTEPGLLYIGLAIDGEVEDYWLELLGSSVAEAPSSIPKSYRLYQNYPNPFNPCTELSYDLPKNSRVMLTIYNLVGAEVCVLVNDHQQAGHHRFIWDGRNSAGDTVPTGLYLVTMHAGGFTATRKLVMLK